MPLHRALRAVRLTTGASVDEAIPTVVLASALIAGAGVAGGSRAATAEGLAAPVTISDGGIPGILPGAVPGDPARGRAIVANRQVGLCLLCHSAPIAEERFQGELATALAGAGDRASAAQLRLRIADPSRLNPETIMPSYFKVEGLNRVGTTFQGKPILSAQQIEDVVAWLLTLREVPR
jgi:sulfur-oxidizing protein SoxX